MWRVWSSNSWFNYKKKGEIIPDHEEADACCWEDLRMEQKVHLKHAGQPCTGRGWGQRCRWCRDWDWSCKWGLKRSQRGRRGQKYKLEYHPKRRKLCWDWMVGTEIAHSGPKANCENSCCKWASWEGKRRIGYREGNRMKKQDWNWLKNCCRKRFVNCWLNVAFVEEKKLVVGGRWKWGYKLSGRVYQEFTTGGRIGVGLSLDPKLKFPNLAKTSSHPRTVFGLELGQFVAPRIKKHGVVYSHNFYHDISLHPFNFGKFHQ